MDDIAKVSICLGLLFLVMKVLGRRSSGLYTPLYHLHKVGPGLATVLAFVHGLTYDPIDLTYTLTGWAVGACMVLLLVIGSVLGFSSKWVPFDRAMDRQNLWLRVVKWVLTVLLIASLGMHYLL